MIDEENVKGDDNDKEEVNLPDESIAVLVEDAESLLDLLLAVRVLHLAGHHCEELREVDGAVS